MCWLVTFNGEMHRFKERERRSDTTHVAIYDMYLEMKRNKKILSMLTQSMKFLEDLRYGKNSFLCSKV